MIVQQVASRSPREPRGKLVHIGVDHGWTCVNRWTWRGRFLTSYDGTESKRLTPKFAQRREEDASHASLSAERCVARGEGGGDAQRAALTAKSGKGGPRYGGRGVPGGLRV